MVLSPCSTALSLAHRLLSLSRKSPLAPYRGHFPNDLSVAKREADGRKRSTAPTSTVVLWAWGGAHIPHRTSPGIPSLKAWSGKTLSPSGMLSREPRTWFAEWRLLSVGSHPGLVIPINPSSQDDPADYILALNLSLHPFPPRFRQHIHRSYHLVFMSSIVIFQLCTHLNFTVFY